VNWVEETDENIKKKEKLRIVSLQTRIWAHDISIWSKEC